MPTNQLTDQVLQTLSEVEADEPVVVSLFFNLDPRTFAAPPARESQINSLMSDLDALIDDEGISRDARESLEADRERIESFLRGDPDVEGAGALAVYASHALDHFTAVKLPQPDRLGGRDRPVAAARAGGRASRISATGACCS